MLEGKIFESAFIMIPFARREPTAAHITQGSNARYDLLKCPDPAWQASATKENDFAGDTTREVIQDHVLGGDHSLGVLVPQCF